MHQPARRLRGGGGEVAWGVRAGSAGGGSSDVHSTVQRSHEPPATQGADGGQPSVRARCAVTTREERAVAKVWTPGVGVIASDDQTLRSWTGVVRLSRLEQAAGRVTFCALPGGPHHRPPGERENISDRAGSRSAALPANGANVPVSVESQWRDRPPRVDSHRGPKPSGWRLERRTSRHQRRLRGSAR